MNEPKPSSEEVAHRGNFIFDRDIRPRVDVERDAHKFVAIDVETGDYEINDRELDAIRALTQRRPEARGRIWLRRVGAPSAHRIGSYILCSRTKA